MQGPSAEMPRGVVQRYGGHSRRLVCAAGLNTHDPRAVPHSLSHPNYPYLEKKTATKWMEHLGKEAHRQHKVVSILCAGTCPFIVIFLQPLALMGVSFFFMMTLERPLVLTCKGHPAGSHGLMEIRCSDDIFITNEIGIIFFFCFNATLSVEETQSFSIFIETKIDIKSDYVFFQFVIQYSNVYQASLSIVITIRLPTV